jgi:cytochrome c
MGPFKVRCFRRTFVAAAGAVITAVSVLAQTPTYPNIGRAPSDDEIRKWDIAVGPSGRELPPGNGDVPQGVLLYLTKHCVVCHGAALEGTQYGPRLAGGAGTLGTPTPLRTVGSYWPYATTVWDYINRAMPRSPYQAGSLAPNEVYALTAFLLYKKASSKRPTHSMPRACRRSACPTGMVSFLRGRTGSGISGRAGLAGAGHKTATTCFSEPGRA